MDFCSIEMRKQKNGVYVFYPDFLVFRSNDLMIRGKSFYAVWDESKGLWSTDVYTIAKVVDKQLEAAAKQFLKDNKSISPEDVVIKSIGKYGNAGWNSFNNYVKLLGDNYHMLDNKIVFSNDEVKKEDYISHKLSYALEEGDTSAWDELVGRLYSPSEKEKIEWAIGAIVTGYSKKIHKFIAFYGKPGTGKSTVIDIIQNMFDGYWDDIDAKALTSENDQFSLAVLKDNPLILVQHDAKLSRIEDNSRLNSLVSHEAMIVNEKHKAQYTMKPSAFVILGTNEPIKITNGKSGLLRRLIDIVPTEDTFDKKDYDRLKKKVRFEYGAIAYKCKQVFEELGPDYYGKYKPTTMITKTDPFYNFVDFYRDQFVREEMFTLKQVWAMYKEYSSATDSKYTMNMVDVRENLKDYFKEYYNDWYDENGNWFRYVYMGFKKEKFEDPVLVKEKTKKEEPWLKFNCTKSLFDKEMADQPAQEANDEDKPRYKWANVITKLKDIDTGKTHYVRVPLYHIVIDFDIKDGDKKSFLKNLEAALQWPPTYAELSKSGQGIHLHYIYKGNPEDLSRIYADNVEIKVFTGNSSLRRKLTKCNDLPIAVITSGLPLKEGGKKVVDAQVLKDEKQLRALIKGNLQKKYLGATKPSMDFINKLCNDAYTSGMHYDISDMGPAIMAFAANSSNNSDYCLDIFNKLKLKSDEPSAGSPSEINKLVFYDIEVFPNLLFIGWKFQGKDQPVHHMFNPSPQEIEELCRYQLVGFNCRRYDNHIVYGRMLGENNEQIYNRSQRIISGSKNGFFGEAYNLSYTDVYDFCSDKMSLKKWEIKLGIHHQELGLPWDQPVPEELWPKVAEYCDNDVISTEVVFDANSADFIARMILADVCDMTVNDTTNSLTTKLIFQGNRNPQSEFNYRDMGKIPIGKEPDPLNPRFVEQLSYPEYCVFYDGKPIFPGYYYDHGKSYYRGEEFGEGGYVFATPGIHWNAWVKDVSSMHPSSIIAEKLFGERYTKRFEELKQARIHIKHGEFEKCKDLLDGKLMKYLTDKSMAKALSKALKIAINSVYGLTSAKFDNAFRDPRNVDNIVAKRGELFMINLKHEVAAKGYKVVHIKTDSIKVEEPDDYILNFIDEYGKLYGYDFEIENHFDRVALVNDAVFIAKRADDDPEWLEECEDARKNKKPIPTQWTATGTQFAVPYVFKTLFSHEEITLNDMCETKSCETSLYLDFNENLGPDEHNYIFVGKVGQFCPVIDGVDGGILLREQDGKFNAVAGTKGWRFKESEVLRNLNGIDQINRDYYRTLCDKAVATIEKFGEFEEFVA